LCKKKLNEKELDGFKRAIVDDYYFEMMLDDLPIWGYVGELETKSIDADHRAHYYLFTHLDFSIAANGPNVIEVNVSAGFCENAPILAQVANPGCSQTRCSASIWVRAAMRSSFPTLFVG